jgi:glycosyltransferase involved in cell wall biosynthesis
MSYKISLLHATRGRSKQAIECRDKWLSSAKNPESIEHIFGIDDDDNDSLANINTARVIVPRGKGCVQAWNACAKACKGDILIQLSDDWEPVPEWDALIIKEFEGVEGEQVLGVSDGARKDDLLCMAILNRKRYEKQGFMFHPDFFSVYSDNYFTWAAQKDKVLKDASHIVFEHKHPVFNKAEWDETYKRSNAQQHYFAGQVKFLELTRADDAKICLAMIVKNEIHNMRRCLESVKDIISYWVICDTGSTDGTQQFIKDLMTEWNIPGELHERPWVDFAHNRTESMKLAKDKADYTLVMDADDYLVVHDKAAFKNLKLDQYHLNINHGGLSYYRTQLVSNLFDWKYVGVLHEYMEGPADVKMMPPVVMNGVTLMASASDVRNGFSGKKKYISDALILEKALLADDLSEGLKVRYTFYQAQSYRDAGANERALIAYEERVALGGWAEEVYYSMYMIARLKVLLKYDQTEIIDAFLKAWEYRPSRADALFDLIIYLRDNKREALAWAFVSIGVKIPPTRDVLFVRQDIQQWRMLDEYSIIAARTGNIKEAQHAAATLVNSPLFEKLVPENERERIKKNFESFNKIVQQ